jgi:hypothetical protein
MRQKPSRPIIPAFIALFVVFFLPLPSSAGRAAIPATDRYVYLSESRETIIAAWSGTEEVLIVTTEIASSEATKVIEFIALPERPTVEAVPETILDRLSGLIDQNAPQVTTYVSGRKTTKGAVIGTDLIDETTIVPHGVAVVKIESFDDFERWVSDCLDKEGIKDAVPDIRKYRPAVSECLARGMTYFVFDVVTVGEKKAATRPLMYRFRTDSLFVPLAVSPRPSGTPDVDLFLVTPGIPKKQATPPAFEPIRYRLPEDIDFSKYPHLLKKYNPLTFSSDHPVSFPIGPVERVRLSPAVASIVPGWRTKAYLTALRYRGSLSSFSADIDLSVDDFELADFDAAGDALVAAEEFRAFAPDGMVNLIAGPSAVPFVAGGTDAYTARAAADGDPSTAYVLPLSGDWTVDLGGEREIEGVWLLTAVTKPDIVPSKNKLCLYASDTGEFAGEERRIDTCIVRSRTPSDTDDDPSTRVDRIALTDKGFTARWLKIDYPYSESISDLFLFEVMIWGEKEE